MSETPAHVNDGYVTDRETAERIWDTARREVREEYQEAMQVERETLQEKIDRLTRLVELLKQPKSAARTAEIAQIEEELAE